MRWLSCFIFAVGAVNGKLVQYEQVEEQIHAANGKDINSNNHQRGLLQNIFDMVDRTSATEDKQLGFGQGMASSRQGVKTGMNNDSGNVDGRAQAKAMGNMGAVGGMGNMGGLGVMTQKGNRTMNMNMNMMTTPAPTTPAPTTSAPSTLIASFSPSPSPFPVVIPTESNRYNKVYLAIAAVDLTAEPTQNQYNALTRRLEQYFETSIRDSLLQEFEAELEEIILTNEFNFFEEGIPVERFNVLMNFDLSATYSDSSIKIPDEESLFIAIRDFAISEELIKDVIRPISPFQDVNEIVFRVSDLEAPP